ncbi:DUF2207 domain-containing protein [Amycolatopsis jiangsuensis]|uniref:Membrane protein DUF2207 n=1 Tax=Amycolatopsis jiangsuensis TaxID=1181879 RepID=A0A840IWW1_9PSEU|nr:DUF2207 domain-containing protein [Amycolatopsis jiangsuensis]MBB4685999.1 hypothetical protein [Amycolatopsis jiangsuensis]
MKLAALLAIPVLLWATATPAGAQDLPALPRSAEVALKVQRDGSLSVTEAVSVPPGTTMTRTIPLRAEAGNDRDRVLSVRDVRIEGQATAETADDQVTFYFRGGTSVIRYTVDGAVGRSLGVENVTWDVAGGWDTRLELVRATFAAPAVPDALTCLSGAPGSASRCSAAQIDHSGVTRVSVAKLPAGSRVQLTAELPGGTVPATERLLPSDTVAGAFAATPPVWWAWLVLGELVCLGAATVLVLRRRDARPGRPVAVALMADGQFSSPDGVLPGHIGTLLTGRTDSVDVAATVLDLCVRNYVWVAEDGPREWALMRRNPPDAQLGTFERAVYEAVLPGESVTLSALREAGVRMPSALRADIVRRRWFSRRTERLPRIGARLCAYGVLLTVLLTFTVGYAQLGLVLTAAGVALTVGARWFPARTSTGLALRDRLLGLRTELLATRPAKVPTQDSEVLFSRALPYAFALGEADAWVEKFARSGRSLTAYWYGTSAEGAEALARTSAFAATLVAAFASAHRGAVRVRPDEPKAAAPA